jgi:hypothetical protein
MLTQPQIVEATANLHHLIADGGTPVADYIVDYAIHFHTTDTMLNQHSDVRDPAIVCFLVLGQCAVAWLLFGLKDDHIWQGETLKASVLPQNAAFWQPILGFIRYPFIVYFASIRGAQKPNTSSCIYNQHILDSVIFLLATVVDFLLLCIFWSCYRSFCSVVTEKRGASGSSSTISSRNRAASSAALRAGKSRWAAKAWFKISSNSRTHLLTFD